ncbi:hypothetical protein V6O07_23785 [Arthrospira platensis SPKY2]
MFYNSIEKISNQVFLINSNFVLKHTVRVAHKRSDGRRELFHSEFTYMSNTAYSDSKYLKSIKLNFSSYLTIEEISAEKEWNMKESIFLNYKTIFKFEKLLKKARKWFYKYDDLYYYNDNNELCINKEVAKPLSLQQNISGKAIVIQPTIIYKNDIGIEGINLYMNNVSTVCKITIDSLEALYMIIKRFDLYLAGISLINYIGRPDSKAYNKDIGIESKNDVNNFYTKNETSQGMQRMYNGMKQEEKKKNEFFGYFK